MNSQDVSLLRKQAIRFAVLLGVVSLFSDVTYESARSLNGPYLAMLGASATAVGVISGLGELIGYGLRLASGFLVDRTRKYWLMTITGYAVNLLAVPLMAFAGRWEFAASLIILERLGKSIRTPARDVMLSHAGSSIGAGWAFGLHEAMDQIGATAGPLIVSAVLYFRGDYRMAYAFLSIPAVLALSSLFIARLSFPEPSNLSVPSRKVDPAGLRKGFWLYMAAVAFIAAGYADFPLIAFHFRQAAVADEQLIPLFYAAAMLADAVAALLLGKLFDRFGLFTVMVGVVFSIAFPPLVFFGGWISGLAGMVFWGIGMAMQESVLRAAISTMIPLEKRGSAFGIFNTGYGISWFLGSAAMGFLYDLSVSYVVIFSMALQAISIVLLLSARKVSKS